MQKTRSNFDLRTSKEVARLLGVSVDCLIRWRQRGEGPPFTQISARKISYDNERSWGVAQLPPAMSERQRSLWTGAM
jgi:hypothetical protein